MQTSWLSPLLDDLPPADPLAVGGFALEWDVRFLKRLRGEFYNDAVPEREYTGCQSVTKWYSHDRVCAEHLTAGVGIEEVCPGMTAEAARVVGRDIAGDDQSAQGKEQVDIDALTGFRKIH